MLWKAIQLFRILIPLPSSDYTVRTAWNLDSFGLSSTMPYLLRGAGVEDLMIQRVHYAVQHDLAYSKQLEFDWQQMWGKTDTVLSFLLSDLSI